MPDMGPRNSRQRKNDRGLDWSFLAGFAPGYRWLVGLIVVVIFSLLSFVGYDFYRYSQSAERLTVKLKVTGLNVIREERVEKVLEKNIFREKTGDTNQQLSHPSILAISSKKVQQTLLENIKRFNSVFVRREFPNRLVIEVKERKPVAIAVIYDSQQERRRGKLIDEEGVMFPPAPDERKALVENLPRVFGLDETEDKQQLNTAWERCRRVIQLNREIFSPDILDWIQIRPAGYFVKIQINRPRTVEVRLGVENYEEKLIRLKKLMATDKFRQFGEYIDLSDPDNIYTGEKRSNHLPESKEKFLYG
ncbi:MAG: cell division protein FtsQ/DivIB [bacterium]